MTLQAWVYPTVVDRAWRDVVYKGDDNYYLEGTTPRNPGVPAGRGSGAQRTKRTGRLRARRTGGPTVP